MNKRQITILGTALLILGGAIGLSFLFASLKEEPSLKKTSVSKKYVKTESVNYGDIKTTVTAFGRVQSSQTLDLLSEVAGRMYQGNVLLKEGQRFRKGDLLFYIDDKEAALNLKSQKSSFLKDLAAILPDIKLDYSESFDQWNEYFNSINIDKALPELPETLSNKEKTFLATKGIYSTYYTIKSSEVRLRKHRYYAPFNGSITNVVIESGAYVGPGNKIGTILRTGALELKVAVETRDIPWITLGSEVVVSSEETQQQFQGEVVRISDFVNQNTQSVDVYVQIAPSRTKIYDGQFLQASIPARTIAGGMIIPRNVLYNGNEVFVLEDTLLKVTEVKIHRLMEEEAIISGVDEGKDIVVEPLSNAHNNMVAYKLDKREIDYGSKASGNTSQAVGN
ncbi:efflux RND transporter periplasmic adaptor subunit [Marinoscillum sp. MHG1-6]|uniref:efflux RND transporter periplasmic adaptor subunit n=1 Tax=Marinoscillum sp. MHG1-6 TaxID=2959627 RepID=UPI002157B48C|nr:HlyD family efflux transporter periplasmic adaptor subunit [Marinoscillum sp. MHG1-6]